MTLPKGLLAKNQENPVKSTRVVGNKLVKPEDYATLADKVNAEREKASPIPRTILRRRSVEEWRSHAERGNE
jgi:hypothetical protein